jgi:hypothetical protein
MNRKKPLKRSTSPIPRYTPPPKATKPIRARKKDPSKRRFAKLRDEAFQGWIREQPCCIPECRWNGRPVECAHVKSRGAGGVDRGNCVPLCTVHHRAQHTMGIRSFQEAYGLDLSAVAAALDVQYTQERAASDPGGGA